MANLGIYFYKFQKEMNKEMNKVSVN
jgi:hypothetical protein